MSARLVLVGLPGSGKSTVGAALAEELGCDFVDVDDAFAELTGSTPAEWLRDRGEAAFRPAESAALALALSRGDDAVVATGGGAVEYEASRRLLRAESLVVYLRCSPGVILERLLAGGDRPLVAAPTQERVAALIARRDPLYGEVATTEVDADGALADVVGALARLVPA